MTIKECDRCKGLYHENRYNVRGIAISGINIATEKEQSFARIDLCDHCINSLYDWLASIDKQVAEQAAKQAAEQGSDGK